MCQTLNFMNLNRIKYFFLELFELKLESYLNFFKFSHIVKIKNSHRKLRKKTIFNSKINLVVVLN